MTNSFTFLACFLTIFSYGQIKPDCSAGGMNSIYVLTNNNLIYRIGNVNSTPSAPVFIDSIPAITSAGITISNNLNGGNYSPTFYTTIQDTFCYREQSGWIKTNHTISTSTGNFGAGNLGGGVNHIYNHRATSGSIYSYNGNSNASNVVLFTSSNSIYDVATDSVDNFYVLLTDANVLYKFDSIGNPIDTLQVTGLPNFLQPGLALLNNTFYAVLQFPTPNALMRGTVNGNVVSFSQIGILNVGSQVQDIAACPFLFNTSSINEFTEELTLSIFPNPFANQVTLQYTNNELSIIAFYNILGQQIFQQSFTNSTLINTEQLLNGIYYYEFINSKGKKSKGKIVKQ